MTGSGSVALGDVQEWSGGPPGCPRMVGRPSRMSGCGWDDLVDLRVRLDALGDVREWSECPWGFPGVVGRPFRLSGSGRVALGDVRE